MLASLAFHAFPPDAAAAEAIAAGQAVAFVGDATAKSYASGKLQLVEELGSVLRTPYGAC